MGPSTFSSNVTSSTKEISTIPTLDLTLSAKISYALEGIFSKEQKQAVVTFTEWANEISQIQPGSIRVSSALLGKDLLNYFDGTFLHATPIILVDNCPEIPYDSLGLDASFFPTSERLHGVTPGAMYYLRTELKDWLPIHFHELIHVVQATLVGQQNYLGLILLGYYEGSYRSAPLEKIAYSLQNRFSYGHRPYDAVQIVREELYKLKLLG